jgi:hypothetical protein
VRTFAASNNDISKATKMKTLGIALLVIGLIITLITGFNYVTREKVVDIGELQISRDKNHSVAWSPIVGVVVMIIGGGILLFGVKKG